MFNNTVNNTNYEATMNVHIIFLTFILLSSSIVLNILEFCYVIKNNMYNKMYNDSIYDDKDIDEDSQFIVDTNDKPCCDDCDDCDNCDNCDNCDSDDNISDDKED
jgi:hypothetical protein